MRNVTINFDATRINCSITLDGEPIHAFSDLASYRQDDFLLWADQFYELLDQMCGQAYRLHITGHTLHHILLKNSQNASSLCQEIAFSANRIIIPFFRRIAECISLGERYPDLDIPSYGNRVKCMTDNPEKMLSVFPEFDCCSEEGNASIAFLTESEATTSAGIVLRIGESTSCTYRRKKVHLTVAETDLTAVQDYIQHYYLMIPFVSNALSSASRHFVKLNTDDKLLLKALEEDTPQFVFPELPNELDVHRKYACDVRVIPHDMQEYKPMLQVEPASAVSVSNGVLTAQNVGEAVLRWLTKEQQLLQQKQVIIAHHQWAEKIILHPKFKQLHPGDEGMIDIQVIPADAEDKNELVFSIDNPSIAAWKKSLNQLWAYECGECVLTVRGKNTSAEMKIRVLPAIESIKLTPSSAVLNYGGTVSFCCDVLPVGAKAESFQWQCDMEPICALKTSGNSCVVRLVHPPENDFVASVTCMVGTKRASASITVNKVSRQNELGCICPALTGLGVLLFWLVYFNIPMLLSLVLSIWGATKDQFGRKVFRNCIIIDIIVLVIGLLLSFNT